VIEFLSQELLKIQRSVRLSLFKQCCELKQRVRLLIMLDGFDEISPLYKQTVLPLLQSLRQTAVEKLWVTTRPHLREELEHKLQQLSYTLETFSDENHFEFLKTFWCQNDWFTGGGNGGFKYKVQIYAKHLIRNQSNQ